MSDEKIYCSDCDNWISSDNTCCANKLVKERHTPIECDYIYPKCIKINKNNDCKYFEQHNPPSLLPIYSLFFALFGAFFKIEPLLFVSIIIIIYHILRKIYHQPKETEADSE